MNPPQRKTAGFDLGNTLDTMDQMHKHQSIVTFMNYPRTEKLNKNDTPIATCNYDCESPTQCDFSECFSYESMLSVFALLILRCIDSNTDLRAYGAQRVLKNIVADFENYPEDHMSAALDGFQIYRGGIDLIRLQRVENKVPMTKTRTGFLEYNNLRDDTYNWYEKQQLVAMNAGINKASQCSIQ